MQIAYGILLTTLSNVASEPITPENLDEMIEALLISERAPDAAKEVWLSSATIKERVEPFCTYKSEPPLPFNTIMGIKMIAKAIMPKDWGLIIYQSGKRVMLNLIDGRTFEVPDVTRI